MSKLNRITRLGMLEDLRIHNEEVAATKHFLTNVVVSPLVHIVLDYVFYISGKIDVRLVDRFESREWPDMIIDGHRLIIGFNNPCMLMEEIAFYCMDRHLESRDVHRMWDAIVMDPDTEYINYVLSLELKLPRDSPMIVAGVKKLCADMIHGYVTIV